MQAPTTMSDFAIISPLIIVCAIGLVSLLVAVFTPHDSFKGWVGYVAAFGFALALAAVVWLWKEGPLSLSNDSFAYALSVDHFGLGMSAVILISGFFAALIAIDYLPAQRSDHGEYYALLAFSALGMMAMVMAADMLTFFVALELMSISVYILAGFKRQSAFSTEAALKYFVTGSFASALLLLGIAFTYGATGSIRFEEVAQALAAPHASLPIAEFGVVLLLAAFFFKIAAAPFHMWTPDVYEGAPTSVTAFMATGVKVAAFGGFARMFLTAFGDARLRTGDVPWETIIAIVAVASMFAGNLMALAQKNLKRMLGYSAIAHTGYILLVMLATPSSADGSLWLGPGLLFYLLGYTLASMAAFGVAAAVSGDDLEDVSDVAYAGLAKRSPGYALILAIAMLSFLGIPLTVGFIGKFTIFAEVLSGSHNAYLWIVVVAIINSIISAFYYLRVILVAYMRDEATERPIQLVTSRSLMFATGLAAALTLAIGIVPNRALMASGKAGESLAKDTVEQTELPTAAVNGVHTDTVTAHPPKAAKL